MRQKCGTCMECVKICPVGALIGENYKEGEEREKRFVVKKCDEYFNSMEGTERMPVCGMCLYACPYGKDK